MDDSSLVDRLTPFIEEILGDSDLSTVSAKAVRKVLIARGEDASEIKKARSAIDQKIREIYDNLTGNASPGSLSPVPSTLGHTEPSSTLPQPFKSAKGRLKAPAVDQGETDEDMAKRLQREFDQGGRSTRAGRPSGPAKRRFKGSERVNGDGEEVHSGREDGKKKIKTASRGGGAGGGFNKELLLSESLADLVGSTRLSRPQVVKHIWDHVKQFGLQDQSDKRYILCDEKLKRVFYTDRLHMFTMNKLLVDHLHNPDDVV